MPQSRVPLPQSRVPMRSHALHCRSHGRHCRSHGRRRRMLTLARGIFGLNSARGCPASGGCTASGGLPRLRRLQTRKIQKNLLLRSVLTAEVNSFLLPPCVVYFSSTKKGYAQTAGVDSYSPPTSGESFRFSVNFLINSAIGPAFFIASQLPHNKRRFSSTSKPPRSCGMI